MSNIEKIDKNLAVKTNINKPNIKFYNVKDEPFKIYGIFYEGDRWRRMPEAVAKTVNEGVYSLHANTAGGRVRFKTNSPYVAISAKIPAPGKMSHFALCGSTGFDMYADNVYAGTFVPPFNIVDGYEAVKDFEICKMYEITINFPLYSDVSELYIGLADGAELLPPTPYKTERPVVFYGSSITQGGCASRSGNSYQGFLSRELDINYINLGFSGNARGEREIAEYIASLDMSAFVYDYDFNTPSREHLLATHEPMFKIIREAHPDIPIIIMSLPKFITPAWAVPRREIIRTTYENAKAAGDENVYFIDGRELMALCGMEGTVDGTHPTDFGFYSMAQRILPVLKSVELK